MHAEADIQYNISLQMTQKEVTEVINIVTNVFIDYTKNGVNPGELKSLLALKDVLAMATQNAKG